MSSSIIISTNRPSRLTPDSKKDKEYHLDFARWGASKGKNNSIHAEWIKNIGINKSFYKSKQWIAEEDLETFLKDKAGNERHRIKVVFNQIRPIVEQYRGNASILKINASAKSISKLSINRREIALAKKITTTRLANEFPGLGSIMRARDEAIGEDEKDTYGIFDNLYVDLYVPQINALLTYGEQLNEYQEMQMPAALNLALTGAVVFECFNHGGHRRSELIESENFFYDTDARKPNMSDASFMGYSKSMDLSYIAEAYPNADPRDIEALEEYCKLAYDTNNSSGQLSNGKPEVYRVYWIDSEKWEYGYVADEDGYPYLTKINFKYGSEESPRYTDEDLITPPDNEKNRKLFKGKNKRKLFFDKVRFCDFVSAESVGGKRHDGLGNEKVTDIVLDFGVLEYQDIESLDFANAKFPIKVNTWGFVDGEIFSPVDDAISPQRLINRIISAGEGLLNISGGKGSVIDEDSIDANGKSSMAYDMKEGNPIYIHSKGKGVPNSIGSYDTTPGNEVFNMFSLVSAIQAQTQNVTGVNEGLKGQSTGSDQLVGVTELLIQRGSLMQEPFYAALSNVFIELYKDMASVGKKFYIDNDRELTVILGDEGAEVVTLSKDLRNEDFRVFVTRENDGDMLKSQANQMLQAFLEFQLIDDKTFANLFDRSTPSEVTMALRSQAGIRAEAKRRAEKDATAQAQAQEQAMVQAQEQDREDKMNMHNDNVDLEMGRQEQKGDEMLLKSIGQQ